MYYSRGNFEAFARARKAKDVDNKTAWIVGSGLAGLSAAAFLVRDAQMPGKNITILEELDVAGGALDGNSIPERGFVTRGGREMEEHFECLWDLFHSVPSLDTKDASVLDEFYWLNKDDPNFSLCRATVNRGEDSGCGKTFTLTTKAQRDLLRMFFTPRKELEGKRINEVMSTDFLESNFWMYWRTMFAFQEWHSALEMKLYLHRFIHHVGALPDFSSLKFFRYNQYEAMVLPLEAYLRDHGVKFQYNTQVKDIDFAIDGEAGRKQATHIHWVQDGQEGGVELGENDFVFTTIGSLTENSEMGTNDKPAVINEDFAPAWELWRKIAAKDPAFGRPEVFCSHIPETKWESATVTMSDPRIPKYIEKVCKRDPFNTGHVTTGGIVTVKDSSWLMSWTTHRQPHFKAQAEGTVVSWIYGLLVDRPGDYVKKLMQDCTGEEIVQEWLYHLGVPEAEIPELASTGASCVPVMMPYVTAFFMPRHAGDRPDVVPEGAANFAFIGQFAETGRDTIFTTEYSVRTGMEAVYRLLAVERGVPEVFASTYDVRYLLSAFLKLRDDKQVGAWLPEIVQRYLGHKIQNSWLGEVLHEASTL